MPVKIKTVRLFSVQGQTVSSTMQSLVQKNLEMKKLTLDYQMMLMAEQTYEMSFKLSIFIRNDGTVLQKFHIRF